MAHGCRSNNTAALASPLSAARPVNDQGSLGGGERSRQRGSAANAIVRNVALDVHFARMSRSEGPGLGRASAADGAGGPRAGGWSYTTFTARQLSLKKQRQRAFNVCIFFESRLLGRDFKLAPVDGCPSGPELVTVGEEERPDFNRSMLVWLVRDSKEDYIYCRLKNVNGSDTGINVISQQYRVKNFH